MVFAMCLQFLFKLSSFDVRIGAETESFSVYVLCVIYRTASILFFVVQFLSSDQHYSQLLHVNYTASRSSETDTRNRNHEPLPPATAGRQSLIATSHTCSQTAFRHKSVSKSYVQCVEG